MRPERVDTPEAIGGDRRLPVITEREAQANRRPEAGRLRSGTGSQRRAGQEGSYRQGGSHALLDGILVAGRLAAISNSLNDGAVVREALEAYERERIPETSKVVKEAGFVGKFVHWRNPVACAFRNLAFYRLTPQAVWRRRAGAYLKTGV